MNTLCTCKYNCTIFAFIASLVIGIVTAFLTITGVITVLPVFLWVLFGISVGYLLLTLFISTFIRDCSECIRTNLNALLTGALGTVLFSLILLAVTFAATSVIGAIITGLLLFSFSFTLISGACLTRCIAGFEN